MNSSQDSNDAWYIADGPDTDVALSSRARIIRNLSGFIFPANLKTDDAERVQSLIFDAINHLEKPERFQMIRLSGIDSLGKRILCERAILESASGVEPWKGVILRNDGVVSATINIEDHLRIAAFYPGSALLQSSKEVFALDAQMEQKLQFSSVPGFGYATSNIFNVGSALKLSVLFCLPSLSMNGLIERAIREFLGQGFIITGFYGSDVKFSLGSLYQMSLQSASNGDTNSQLQLMQQGVEKLIELERKARIELLSQRKTEIEDVVYRAIVTAKYARFISVAEGVSLLEKIRLGINLKMITGIVNKDLTALLYRIQPAHIHFVISTGSIIIEDDVTVEEMKLDRLRAMVIQEVLKNADIQERR